MLELPPVLVAQIEAAEAAAAVEAAAALEAAKSEDNGDDVSDEVAAGLKALSGEGDAKAKDGDAEEPVAATADDAKK